MANLLVLVEHEDFRVDEWDDERGRKVRALIKREGLDPLPDLKYWVRIPQELWNGYVARRAFEGLDQDPHEALKDLWFHSITYWKKLGVTNRELVGSAVWG